jgi:hypothetical protein
VVADKNAIVDAAAQEEFFDRVGDVDESAAAFDFEPEMFDEGFHYSKRYDEGIWNARESGF